MNNLLYEHDDEVAALWPVKCGEFIVLKCLDGLKRRIVF